MNTKGQLPPDEPGLALGGGLGAGMGSADKPPGPLSLAAH